MAKRKIINIFGYESLNRDLGDLIARLQFLPEIASDIKKFQVENDVLFSDVYGNIKNDDGLIDRIAGYQLTMRNSKKTGTKNEIAQMISGELVSRIFPEGDIDRWSDAYKDFQNAGDPILTSFTLDFLIPLFFGDKAYKTYHKFMYTEKGKNKSEEGKVERPLMDSEFIPLFVSEHPGATLTFTRNSFEPSCKTTRGVEYISQRGKYGDSVAAKVMETCLKGQNENMYVRIPGEDLCQDLLGARVVSEQHNHRVDIARDIIKKILDEKGLPQDVTVYQKKSENIYDKEKLPITTGIFDRIDSKLFERYDTIVIEKTGQYYIVVDSERLMRGKPDPRESGYKAIHMNISMPFGEEKKRLFYTIEIQVMDSLNDQQESGKAKFSHDNYRRKLEVEKRNRPYIVNYVEKNVLQRIFDKM